MFLFFWPGCHHEGFGRVRGHDGFVGLRAVGLWASRGLRN